MANIDKDNAEPSYGKIVARAWRDPAFKARLLTDPHAILREAGVTVPPGIKVSVVENTATQHFFVLPESPSGELSDDNLDKVAGGGGHDEYPSQGHWGHKF